MKHRSLVRRACFSRCLFLSLSLLGSCRKNKESSAIVAHTEQESFRKMTPPFGFYDLSEYSVDSPQMQFLTHGEVLLPRNLAAVKRVQSWLDAFHSAMLKTVMNGVEMLPPKPLAVVVANNSPNAFSVGFPRCWNIPVETIGAAKEQRVASATAIHFSGEQGTLIPVAENLISNGMLPVLKNCYSPSAHELTEIVNLMKESMKRTNPECSVEVDNRTFITNLRISRACHPMGTRDHSTLHNSHNFSFNAQSNAIVVTTGMLEMLESDAALGAILGHELGHYYNSDSYVGTPQTHYGYQDCPTRVAGRPECASPEVAKLLDDVYKWALYPKLRRDPALEFDVTLSNLARYIPSESELGAGASPELQRHCLSSSQRLKEFRAHVLRKLESRQRINIDSYIDNFSFIYDNFHDEVVEIISKNTECLKAVKLNNQQEIAGFSSLIQIFMPGNNYLPLTDRFNELPTLSPGASLYDLLVAWEWKHKENNRIADGVFAKARESQVGIYTYEQRADDVSLQLLAAVGVGTEVAPQTQWALWKGRHFVTPGYRDDTSWEECEKKMIEWKKGNFSIVELPGFWGASHHSYCFRAFNMYKEIGAHGYKERTPVVKFEPLNSMQWTALMAEVKATGPLWWFRRLSRH